MSQPRYLIGLMAFALCYALLGANNTAVPVLLSRGLNLPLEVIGLYVAWGSLGGVLVWILLSRLVPRHPGPTRYYILGFSLLAVGSLRLGGLSETVEPRLNLLPALLCNSAFVIAVLSTTALQTFRDLQRDETLFSHANQVKNVLAQFGVSAGMCIAMLFLQWRTTLHYGRLGESVGLWNPALQDTLHLLAQRYGAIQEPEKAMQMATAFVNGLLVQEATFMASLDYFNGIAAFSALCLLTVLAERAWRYSLQLRSRFT